MQNYDALILISKKISLDANKDSVLAQALRIAIYNEYKAFETYKAILNSFNAKEPFTDIMQAEIRHFEALKKLCEKYEVTLPINDLAGDIKTPKTLQECYELGVASEIENIAMYDYLLTYVSDYDDVVDIFYRLQAVCINKHLPTFRACVLDIKNQDIMEKFNEFSGLAQKFQSGEFDPNDITKLLSQGNVSLLAGLVAGGFGGLALNNFLKDNLNKIEE